MDDEADPALGEIDVAAIEQRELLLAYEREDLREQLLAVRHALDRRAQFAGEGREVGVVQRVEFVQPDGSSFLSEISATICSIASRLTKRDGSGRSP